MNAFIESLCVVQPARLDENGNLINAIITYNGELYRVYPRMNFSNPKQPKEIYSLKYYDAIIFQRIKRFNSSTLVKDAVNGELVYESETISSTHNDRAWRICSMESFLYGLGNDKLDTSYFTSENMFYLLKKIEKK